MFHSLFRHTVVLCLLSHLVVGCSDQGGKIKFESILITTDAKEAGIPENILKLAKRDHIQLLKMALAKYDELKITNYNFTLIRQERIEGKMYKEQEITGKFMAKPFSVAMEWVRNAPLGDAMVYVEGRYKDKNGRSQMLVRPKGWLAQKLVGKSVLRLPDGKDAMKNTLKPCTEFGLQNGLKLLLKYYLLADKNRDMRIAPGGAIEIGGRKCVVLVREISKEKAGDEGYPAKITEVCLDIETLLPLRIVGYDWDNRMFCTYEFRNVAINPGLTEKDFTPEACGISPPKK